MEQIKPKAIFETSDKSADRSIDSKAQQTSDGFRNFALKLGISPRGDESNNALSGGHYDFNLVTRNRVQLEAAYRGSWIVGRVVDCVAEDMTKSGVILNTNDGAELVQEFKVQMSRLQIWSSLCDAIKWGRLYGGAIAVMQIDGQKLDTPLNLKSIEKDQFKGLVVYDRWQLYPVLDKLIESGPNMGLPAYYDIVLGSNLNDPAQEPGGQTTSNQNGRVRVHHSRCIRTGGHKLPFFQAITEMMWDESVIERLWDRLIEFDTATSSAGGLITRANLRTVGIDGLREILAAGGSAQEALVEQFEYMRKFQSNEGITLLDKNDEFQSTAYSFAGLSDTIIQFGQQLSGSCEIPLVRLFGQSPTGLNSTGESDIRNYYDSINSKQESNLRNSVECMIKVLWQSMTGVPAPKDLSFVFTPLWQMSAMDKAAIAKTNTDTLIEAHQEGGIDTATLMKELKQLSTETGLFTHITDEQIDEADVEDPPMPNSQNESQNEQQSELQNKQNSKTDNKKKSESSDSAWIKIKRWISRDHRSKRMVNDTAKDTVKELQDNKDISNDQKLILNWIK